MNRELLNYGVQFLFWLALVFFGYHLYVQFFAAGMVGYNAERFSEAWRRKDGLDNNADR